MLRAISLSVLVLSVSACGPGAPALDDDSGEPATSAAASSTSSSATSSDVGLTADEVPVTGGATTAIGTLPASTSEGSTWGTSPGDDDGLTFIFPPDGGPHGDPCDVWAQDCPPGEKCAPYANDGGGAWNDLKCVPVVDDPAQPGEPCVAEGGGVSGIDDCALGAYCWEVDPEGKGTCISLCSGAPESPVCPSGSTCATTGDGVINLCLLNCHPLEDPCAGDDLCVGYNGEFVCVLDTSGDGGQVNDPCEYVNACDPGLSCIDATYAGECDGLSYGCCQPFCDTTEPNACAGAGQECLPWYDEMTAPAGFENVGVCAVPV